MGVISKEHAKTPLTIGSMIYNIKATYPQFHLRLSLFFQSN
jgi:hypothetical protein